MKVLYSKYSRNRRPRFSVETRIVEDNGNRFVLKLPQTEVATEHIKNIVKNGAILSKIYGDIAEVCPIQLKADTAVFDYIEGVSLSKLLRSAAEENDVGEVNRLIDLILSLIRARDNPTSLFEPTAAYSEIFGAAQPPNDAVSYAVSNMDLTPDNIIISGGKPVIIDYEWVFDFPIPTDFLLYRTLKLLYYHNNINFGKFYTFEELTARAGIKTEDSTLRLLEQNYTAWIHPDTHAKDSDTGLFNSYRKPVLNAVTHNESGVLSVNFDTGEGYSPESELIYDYSEGRLTGQGRVPKNCRSIQVNIEQETDSCISPLEMDFDGITHVPEISEKDSEKNYGTFVWRLTAPVNVFSLSGQILNASGMRHQDSFDTTEKFAALQSENSELRKLYEENRRHLASVLNSRSWRAMEKLKRVKALLTANINKLLPYKGLKINSVSCMPIKWQNTQSTDTIRDEITCTPEYMGCDDNILELRGWIYARKYPIESIGLEIIQEGDITCIPLKFPIQRHDVADIAGKADIAACGFDDMVLIPSDKAADISFVLKNEKGTAKLFLGRVLP